MFQKYLVVTYSRIVLFSMILHLQTGFPLMLLQSVKLRLSSAVPKNSLGTVLLQTMTGCHTCGVVSFGDLLTYPTTTTTEATWLGLHSFNVVYMSSRLALKFLLRMLPPAPRNLGGLLMRESSELESWSSKFKNNLWLQ